MRKGTTVLEQNYQFDLVSTEKLLQKYVDRPIAVEQVRGQATETFNGTLLSTQGRTRAPARRRQRADRSRTTPASSCPRCPAA